MRNVRLRTILFVFFAFLGSFLYSQCIPNYYILRPRAECLGNQGVKVIYTQEHYVAHDIYRKTPNDTSWGQPISPNYWGSPQPMFQGSPILMNQFVASDHLPGQTYEYRITRTFENIGSFSGYVLAGCEVSETINRGNVILLVSSELKPSIVAELETMRKDLVADGYLVYMMDVSESSTPPIVKGMIQNIYPSLEGSNNYLYIIGHVPVPYSGFMMSDDQPTHRGAWPADVYYGDLDGIYTDETVNTTVPARPENDNVPGDGKFDQNLITSKPEIAVGRADFSRLPCFVGKTEAELTKRYLQKNHAFRNDQVSHSGNAFMCDNMEFYYGNNASTDGFIELYSKIGDNNFSALTNDLFPNYAYFLHVRDSLQSHSYLTSYISGTSGYTNIDNIFTAGQINQMSGINSVFNWSFGAFFGDWDNPCNLMRMFIGSPGTALTQIWAGNPSAYFHMFGFDRTIGQTIVEHQWNFNTIHHNLPNPNADNYYRRVHIALMGDPTLRLDFESPPVNPSAVLGVQPGSVSISWASNGDAQAKYLVFRAQSDDQPFELIGETQVNQLSFLDLNPLQGQSVYMVRAKALHTTGSGSFYNLSSGRFATYNNVSSVSVAFQSDVICLPANQVEINYSVSNNLNNAAATVVGYLSNPNTPILSQNIVLNSNTPVIINLPAVPANSWVKFRTTVNNFPLAAILDSVRVEEIPSAEIVYEIQNGLLALTANGTPGSSFEWVVNGEVVSDQEVYSLEITSPQYSIDLNVTNQCGTSTTNLEVNITGFEYLIPTDWNLFPNPTKGEVNLKTQFPFESYLISDLTGRILLANHSNGLSNCETINIQSLTSGIYFCTVLFNGKSFTKKLIVN
jgi:hypothetical protein